ncbi:DUF7322 domain-containing protein [Halobaculum sp. P14]|uniref:DUF7322 domain-containing protein n=1 Tax=Halobaculum sp. P14 TaxID=3421638 RepID=UPI003EBB7DD8
MLDEDDSGEPPAFDVEERWGNPEEDLAPETETPEVRNPADGLPDPADVDQAVQSAFWAAVVYANVALFGVALGAMLVGFRGDWAAGGAAILVGLLAAGRVYQTYRAFRDRDDAENGDDVAEDSDGENPADADEDDAASRTDGGRPASRR